VGAGAVDAGVVGAGLVASVAGLAAVSDADAEDDVELDFGSFDASTAQVTESAGNASVTAISEGRKNLFSLVQIGMGPAISKESFHVPAKAKLMREKFVGTIER